MNYATPYDIGIGDNVTYKGSDYQVLINYIEGETDAKGYTPTMNRTVLIDNMDIRITCLDYKELEVIWWLFVTNLSQDTQEQVTMGN